MASINRKAQRPKRPVLICITALFLITAGSLPAARAQTFAEWFAQKKTQLKYLTQQIAALEQYGHDAAQGYQLAQRGWNGIGGWVGGELTTHTNYYQRLRRVNPVIRQDPRVRQVLADAQAIPGQFDLPELRQLPPETRAYISRVKTNLLLATDQALAGLEMILTDGRVEMSDDERLNRLAEIAAGVRDQLGFARAFAAAVSSLARQQAAELRDVHALNNFYGIPD